MNGGLSLYQDDNSTPLTLDEIKGLIPTHVTMRSELNELEQKNILQADSWVFKRKRTILDEDFLRRLHKRMFGDVWNWAGVYRSTPRNLGVEPWHVQIEMRKSIDDAIFWIDNKTYDPDEIAVRFHHRLVVVHPFPNGNGRWSRLAADILVTSLSRQRFSWGGGSLQKTGDIRKRYIDALRAADMHDLSLLIAFARS